ncbi:hypothetical protein Q8W71_32155 [Methylobacterium sp. NEAU 140]|uniref:DUF6894 family protein n=1 Tax=Methylobacterium sp. NEAU 140 TaxID=3064945 RepID=UPI0027349D79|nr:hypothetical protein [Methylobacterium sp. NEAU 140]MDP4027228.1 hypothetical protein [Methylobacterium sp. NEAU 140]
MPRYLVTTYDGITVSDPGGIELPDLDALAIVLRQTLSAIMHDEGGRPGRNEFWADAHNECGERVMTARVSLSVAVP